MKKFLSVLAFVAVTAFAFTTFGNTKAEEPELPEENSDPYEAVLYAGKPKDGVDNKVGGVQVWNDAEKLYVQLFTDDSDWCMTEVHIQVANDVDGVPQTQPNKKGLGGGNPIPGHFAVNEELEACTQVSEAYEWVMADNGWTADSNLVVAVHAVVRDYDTEHTDDCIVSGVGTDDVLYLDEDLLNPGYPDGYTAPYQTYIGNTDPSVETFTHSAWLPYSIAGAMWIGSSYLTENTDYNTWRLFTRNFNLPENASNISGSLTMNADNAEDAYLNGQFILDGNPAIVYGVPVPPSGPQHGWSSVEGPVDISSELQAGSNELWTMTRNYAWAGGPTANPSGLTYKLCYGYDVVTYNEETAWAGEEDFPGANWARYFTYEVFESQIEVCKTDTDNNPLEGWTVSLDEDAQLTGENGCYTWTVYGPGEYVATEETRDFWTPVDDTEYTFNVTGGGESYTHTFVNREWLTLELENKNTSWVIQEDDGIYGVLRYDPEGDRNFEFSGYGLTSGLDYSLVSYKESSGIGSYILGLGIADSEGSLEMFGDMNVVINDYPCGSSGDYECISGAKIWIVTSSRLSDNNTDGYADTFGWPSGWVSNTLFETELIFTETL